MSRESTSVVSSMEHVFGYPQTVMLKRAAARVFVTVVISLDCSDIFGARIPTFVKFIGKPGGVPEHAASELAALGARAHAWLDSSLFECSSMRSRHVFVIFSSVISLGHEAMDVV